MFGCNVQIKHDSVLLQTFMSSSVAVRESASLVHLNSILKFSELPHCPLWTLFQARSLINFTLQFFCKPS
jgi:hypothetical protein